MKITAHPSLDYTGLFTFGDIDARIDSFTVSSGQAGAIAHTVVDWMPMGTLVGFDEINPLMGQSVAHLARALSLQDTVLAISWDAMSLPFANPESFDSDQPAIAVQDILNGAFDDYIRAVAQQTKAIDLPVMMTLFGEADSHALFAYGADGDQFVDAVTDTTGQYGDPTALDGPERVRDAMKHVIDIFNAEGADNVTWFQYMASDALVGEGTIDPSLIYAGDDHIDWVGQSLYLQDASALDASLAPGYDAWAAITDKPFFIPEMGLLTPGGDQVAAVLEGLQGYGNVGAHVWSSFEGMTEVWGVLPIGTDASEWAALGESPWLAADVVVLDDGGTGQGFGDWQDATGRRIDPSLFEGTEGADVMVGQTEAIDRGDTLIGLGGDDVYVVDHVGDRIVEAEAAGHDIVLTTVDHELGANVEDLLGEGTGALHLVGNALDNLILGTEAANTIEGGAGDDVLDGQGGGDVMAGGAGDDYLDGGLGDDVLDGGLGADVLMGGAGDDRLILEGGDDYAVGGLGADTFEFRSADAMAIIEDFEAGIDVLDLSGAGFDSHQALQAATMHVGGEMSGSTPGADDMVIIQVGAEQLVLVGLTEAGFDASLILI